MDIIESMKKEMLRRKLSRKTIKTYLFYVKKFLLFCDKEPKQFSKKDCREFLERYMYDRTGSTLNVALNSLRFMMEEVLRKSMRLKIRYSKTPKTAAICLSKEEIKALISVIDNPKHKMIVCLMYGAGLRVSEVLKLKPHDLELEQDIGWVRRGKGNKDRPFILPQSLKADLKKLIARSDRYLFPGQNGHLSARSVQEIMKKAAKNAKIKKKIHPHTLRHSFATHLLEAGNDVTVVQALLGHNEARTTLEYLHNVKPRMISVKSPIDTLTESYINK